MAILLAVNGPAVLVGVVVVVLVGLVVEIATAREMAKHD